MAAGKVHHSTFTYPPPPQQGGKVLHERRNTPHSSKVASLDNSVRVFIANPILSIALSLSSLHKGFSLLEEVRRPHEEAVSRSGSRYH